jgi:hypothetical protein
MCQYWFCLKRAHAAFDTVDDEILIQRLETKFGFKHTVLALFSSLVVIRIMIIILNLHSGTKLSGWLRHIW